MEGNGCKVFELRGNGAEAEFAADARAPNVQVAVVHDCSIVGVPRGNLRTTAAREQYAARVCSTRGGLLS